MKLEEMLKCQHTVRCLHAAAIDAMVMLNRRLVLSVINAMQASFPVVNDD